MMEHEYPDVLGSITDGVRMELDTLQCALGVYPPGSAVGQPFELLVLLQSRVDSAQEVNLAVRLPTRDGGSRRLAFDVPQKQIKISLDPGEVSLLYLPVMAQSPTPPAHGYPVMVHVSARPLVTRYKPVRPVGEGQPPSALTVSPFRLEVLRDVRFSGEGMSGQLRARFDVIPGQVKMDLIRLQPKAERLWGVQDFRLEQERLDTSMALADSIAHEFTSQAILADLEDTTEDLFARAGLPLHPGEITFVSKAIGYIFDDAYHYEQFFELHEARWFHALANLLIRNEDAIDADRGTLAAGPLYIPALYDAVKVGLTVVQSSTNRDYGDEDEQRQYAEKVVQAIQGDLPMDLSYVYLPLVMAGVLLNMRVTMPHENLWTNLDRLDEALRGRAKLAGSGRNDIFASLERLILRARDLLKQQRIPRP